MELEQSHKQPPVFQIVKEHPIYVRRLIGKQAKERVFSLYCLENRSAQACNLNRTDLCYISSFAGALNHPPNRSMKMTRDASISDYGLIWIILDGVSLIRNTDGGWCRVAPPSADDLIDNWYRASSSLLIRRPDAKDKMTWVTSNQRQNGPS